MGFYLAVLAGLAGMYKFTAIGLGIIIASYFLDEMLSRADAYWRKKKRLMELCKKRSKVFRSIPVKETDPKIFRIAERLSESACGKLFFRAKR